MEKSIQESMKSAQAHLEKEEFNEGLAILNELPFSPVIEDLRRKIEQARRDKINSLLNNFETELNNQNWNLAAEIIQAAQTLDGKDDRVQAAITRLTELSKKTMDDEEIAEKKHRAKLLLDKSEKTIADLETAIHLLDEIISHNEGDIEAKDLYDKAQRARSEFLRSQGQVATLEQAEEYEEALKQIRDLIQRGWREFDGKDIFEYRGELENKAQDFAEQKAGKYLSQANDVLENDPKLALRYIERGLELPFIPAKRRQDLEDLKIKAERANEKFIKVDKIVQEALELMNKDSNYEKAINVLENALGIMPNFSEAKSHLDRAQQRLKKNILNNARSKIARIKTWISQGQLDKARTEILTTSDELGKIDEEGDALRHECDKLLDEINKKEQIEREVTEAVKSANIALENGKLDEIDTIINALAEEAQDHSDIRKLKAQLAKRLDIKEGIEKARQAYEDGRLESAREQVVILKRRARDNEEIIRLYNEVESSLSYVKGEEFFNDGILAEAKKTFQKVIKLDTLYQDEAKEKLEQIDELKEVDRLTRSDYNKALKHKEQRQFEDAYDILNEIGDNPTTIKEQIITLRNEVRQLWREQLIKQIKENLKAKKYDGAFDFTQKLENIQTIDDSKLIYDVKKRFHIHKAGIASSQRSWKDALLHWQKAQSFDAHDPRIIKGLLEAKKNEAKRVADFSDDLNEIIGNLENILDNENIDIEVDNRLWRAYILSEEYGKALHLANLRLKVDSEYSTKVKRLKSFCMILSESKEKFNLGAYRECIDILNNTLKKFSEYSDIITELSQKRKQEIIDKLLTEAKELENRGENIVYILPRYQELLSIEPNHKEAKQRNTILLEDFKRYITDLIQECIFIENEENITIDDIDDKINEIRNAMIIATDQQQTKLKPHLDRISSKRRSLQAFEKKITGIRGLLFEAKENGEFSDVDRELSEALSHTSMRNLALNKLIREIQEIKDRRNKAVNLVTKTINAFKELDFSTIESLSDDLLRIDPDDEFSLQRKQLNFKDQYKNEDIDFKELKIWAQQRRQNIQKLTMWFEENRVDTNKLEQEENKLRGESEKDHHVNLFVKGLENLVDDYRKGTEKLAAPRELPLSEQADHIIKTAEEYRMQLSKKANELEEEANSLIKNEKIVQELIEEASKLIEKRDFSEAKPLVEKGWELSPSHPVLRHYRELIQDELE